MDWRIYSIPTRLSDLTHTHEQINGQGCFSYHMGECLCRGFDAGCINSMYYLLSIIKVFIANMSDGIVIISSC
jgi:hypothetical protein